MKLAEALLVRADMQKKIASLRERIGKYAVVQDGDEPHEDPHQLIEEACAAFEAFESLTFRINQSNLNNTLADGRTLTAAIAHRDTLVGQHALINHAIERSQNLQSRYSMTEIKWVATLNVASLQRQADDFGKQIRELNVAIQQTNWTVELGE